MRHPMSRVTRCRGQRNELTAANSKRDEVTAPRFDSEAEDERGHHSRKQTAQSSVLQVQQAIPQLVDRTIEVFQGRSSKVLTREDARQITENVVGFFTTLMEWEANEQRTINKIKRAKPDSDCHSMESPLE